MRAPEAPLARRLLAEWDDTEDAMRRRFHLPQGHLAVAAMPSFAATDRCLSPTLSAYQRHRSRCDQRTGDGDGAGAAGRVRYRLRTAGQRGLTLPVEFESHQLTTVGQLVGKGLGVSAVPALCRAQMEALGVYCLPLCEPVIERQVGILTRADQRLSSTASVFHELVANSGRELLDSRNAAATDDRLS